MPGFDQEDELSGNRQIVLILRLVLDHRSHLRHGELIDAEAISHGRFVSLNGLADVVNGWFERQYRDDTAEVDPMA